MRLPKAVFIAIVLLFSFSAKATIYNVNSTTDGSALNQLRGALTNAALTVGPHTVNVAAGTYNLTLGTIVFGNLANQNISIVGADSANTIINMTTTLQGRIFNIGNGSVSGVQISISGIKFTGGRAGLAGADSFGGGAIIAGGPTCLLSITGCVFDNNAVDVALGGFGGAITMQGGGTLTVANCNFRNNSNAGGDGGALDYFLPSTNGLAGAVSITGSVFFNNSVTGTALSGGAINLGTQATAPGQTFTCTVQKNQFLQNHADAAGSAGGAIQTAHSFAAGNIMNIILNRFVGNTANTTNTSALAMATSDGSVNAINNWWGCNTGPTSGVGCDKASITGAGGGGTLTTAPYLTLTATASPASFCNSPANTSTITASFLKNSANTTLTTADIAVLIGLPINFSATGVGFISGAQTTIQPSGMATATLNTPEGTPPGTGGTATVDNGTTAALVTVIQSTLPIVAKTVTQATGVNNNVYQTACEFLAAVVPSAPTPVSGSVTTKVWIESTVPVVGTNPNARPFVQRHYEIQPATGASTATADVTLYFTQAEFNAFNAHPGSTLDLPANSGDVFGKANLRVSKYTGTSNNGLGLPASYTNGAMVIDPPDNQIIYNTNLSRWEVTFPVTGFSGFFVQTSFTVLPVKIISFTGKLNKDLSAALVWDVEEQFGVEKYIVEKSTDGSSFQDLGTVAANNAGSYRYTFADPAVGKGVKYYRLRILNNDGRITYSNIISLQVKDKGSLIIYPNPVTDVFSIKSDMYLQGTAQLTDLNGRTVKTFTLNGAQQSFNISQLPQGLYLLKFEDGTVYKITKQ